MLVANNGIDIHKSLKGATVRFPYGAGYAHYTVVKNDPLTLEHIPFHDSWRLPPYVERNLKADDIIKLLEAGAPVK